MLRQYDNYYVDHCMDDLEELKQILKCEEKLDCIIKALKDYKRFKTEVLK